MGISSMRVATAVIASGLASAVLAQSPPQPAAPARLTIGYVEVTDDPRYEPITGYGRLVLKQRAHPFAGAEVGLDEAQALARVARTQLALERMRVASPAEVADAVLAAHATRDMHYFIV